MDQSSNSIALRSPNGLAKHFSAPSASTTILLVLTWIVVVLNIDLWASIGDRLDITSSSGYGYTLALSSMMITILGVPLLLFGYGWLLKTLLSSLLILSSTLAYFTREYGIVYDVEMIRNVLETITNRSAQDFLELISWSLIFSIAITALPPILWIFFTSTKNHSILTELFQRAISIFIIITITTVLVLFNYKSITFFSRENNDLEIYVNPHFALASAVKLARKIHAARKLTFTSLGNTAAISKRNRSPTIGVMVVGDTARADHFSLNGYARETNPLLSKSRIVNFSNTIACGTSTTYSLPCMFSFLTAENYSPEAASSQSNVLDVLYSAGVQVTWLDNNYSCKGVCKRIQSINLMRDMDDRSIHYIESTYYDEVLLGKVRQLLQQAQKDTLIVLHTLGSHGPAYFRRFPGPFAKFTPFCRTKVPQNCTVDEIVNAYDNTILYTDYILSLIIAHLKTIEANTFMFYASDHGESLGENGIYLHGLPKILAPKAQLHIPMIAWFSPTFHMSNNRKTNANIEQISFQTSHDNISATLLGLYDVQTSLYRENLDLFSDPN